jgi:hypothetical protein
MDKLIKFIESSRFNIDIEKQYIDFKDFDELGLTNIEIVSQICIELQNHFNNDIDNVQYFNYFGCETIIFSYNNFKGEIWADLDISKWVCTMTLDN